jgi:hypothetical protein
LGDLAAGQISRHLRRKTRKSDFPESSRGNALSLQADENKQIGTDFTGLKNVAYRVP